MLIDALLQEEADRQKELYPNLWFSTPPEGIAVDVATHVLMSPSESTHTAVFELLTRINFSESISSALIDALITETYKGSVGSAGAVQLIFGNKIVTQIMDVIVFKAEMAVVKLQEANDEAQHSA